MQTNHVFFSSFEQWRNALDTHAGVFGLPISRQEKTNLNGVLQVSLLIHLAQIRDERTDHCLILVAQYFDPPMRDEVPPLQTRLNQAWDAIKHWLAEERITLIEAVVSYPKDLWALTAVLPDCFRGKEANHDNDQA